MSADQLTRRDFLRLAGLGAGAVGAAALGLDQVAASTSGKKDAQGVDWQWGPDIEQAKKLPPEVLKSKEFAEAVHNLRNRLATLGLSTWQYTAEPFVSYDASQRPIVRFIATAKDNGDLLFFEENNLVSRIALPKNIKRLEWDFQSDAVVGKDTGNALIYKVEKLVPPNGNIAIEKDKYGVGINGLSASAVFTGELYRQEILDKGINWGVATIARGMLKGVDGVQYFDFLVGLTTSEESGKLDMKFLHNGKVENGSGLIGGMRRGMVFKVGTPYIVNKQAFIEIGNRNGNIQAVSESVYPMYNKTTSSAKNNIRDGEFPFYNQFPTIAIENS